MVAAAAIAGQVTDVRELVAVAPSSPSDR